jgi:hypothetical protein
MAEGSGIWWNAGWQFCNYHEQFGVLGYLQNYRANTGYSSVLWSFSTNACIEPESKTWAVDSD